MRPCARAAPSRALPQTGGLALSLVHEDILVCEEEGGRKLNAYSAALVASGSSAVGCTPEHPQQTRRAHLQRLP